jgi:hypothetical protein
MLGRKRDREQVRRRAKETESKNMHQEYCKYERKTKTAIRIEKYILQSTKRERERARAIESKG